MIGSFLAGTVLRAVAGPRDRVVALLDRYVLRVALPALILSKMSRASFGGDTVVPIVIAWVCISVSAVVIMLVGRVAGWGNETIGALLLVGVLGNTSFLGLGVVQGLLGRSSLPSAIAFDQLGTFLALATYGSIVAGRFGSGPGGWRVAVIRLASFTPFQALIASVVVGALGVPAIVYRILDMPAATVAPVAMFSLGWRFTVGDARSHRGLVAMGLMWKMLVVPLGVLAAGASLGVRTDQAWAASVLQAGAPPMVTAGVVAAAAGLDSAVASLMVAVGTVAAAVTLPLMWLAVR